MKKITRDSQIEETKYNPADFPPNPIDVNPDGTIKTEVVSYDEQGNKIIVPRQGRTIDMLTKGTDLEDRKNDK